MKKLVLYIQLFAMMFFLYACGGNQRENMQDTPVEEDILLDEGAIPMDSLERDSLDTLQRMLPTPPLD